MEIHGQPASQPARMEQKVSIGASMRIHGCIVNGWCMDRQQSANKPKATSGKQGDRRTDAKARTHTTEFETSAKPGKVSLGRARLLKDIKKISVNNWVVNFDPIFGESDAQRIVNSVVKNVTVGRDIGTKRNSFAIGKSIYETRNAFLIIKLADVISDRIPFGPAAPLRRKLPGNRSLNWEMVV